MTLANAKGNPALRGQPGVALICFKNLQSHRPQGGIVSGNARYGGVRGTARRTAHQSFQPSESRQDGRFDQQQVKLIFGPLYCCPDVSAELFDGNNSTLTRAQPRDRQKIGCRSDRSAPGSQERALRIGMRPGYQTSRLIEPSKTRAMKCGLCDARQNSILFVDDAIIPERNLIQSHWDALEITGSATCC